jgi:hypothetical protein
MLSVVYLGEDDPLDALSAGDVLPYRGRFKDSDLVVVGASCHPRTCAAFAHKDDVVLVRGPHHDATEEAAERHRLRRLTRSLVPEGATCPFEALGLGMAGKE